MPELPEVETVRVGLERSVVGRRIARVEVFGPRTLRRYPPGPAEFAHRLVGRVIVGARRRGKYLWLPLDDGAAMLAHLGMSGQFLAVGTGVPVELHLRARLGFADSGPELRFVDQRTFGGLGLTDDVGPDGVPAAIGHVAPDPLEEAFDPAAWSAAVRRRRTGVKRAVLDQRLISGVGNIYADEALWHARMHFARATDRLTRADADRLLAAVRGVLVAAIAAGGTSFDALYVDVDGAGGWFERELEVYGREGEPCSRCGSTIVRMPFMGRSSYLCPRCQPRPRSPRW